MAAPRTSALTITAYLESTYDFGSHEQTIGNNTGPETQLSPKNAYLTGLSLERTTGFEPATLTWQRVGIRPSGIAQCVYVDCVCLPVHPVLKDPVRSRPVYYGPDVPGTHSGRTRSKIKNESKHLIDVRHLVL